jgi:acetate CoA/acetoacetate CoA-transferase beta subunit
VNLIVTELAVIEVTKDGLQLREVAPTATIEVVCRATEAELLIPESVANMVARQSSTDLSENTSNNSRA